MHSHDNTQSLMFITFQNKKISSVFTLCLLNRKKMKEANRGKTTKIISNFPGYPFHLDAVIIAQQSQEVHELTGGKNVTQFCHLNASLIRQQTVKEPMSGKQIPDFNCLELFQPCRFAVPKDTWRGHRQPASVLKALVLMLFENDGRGNFVTYLKSSFRYLTTLTLGKLSLRANLSDDFC